MSVSNPPNLRARRFMPTQTLPPERPQVASQPCAACGAEVDPLRAPCVVAFEDGIRVLCSETCKKNHRSGERSRRKTAPLTTTPPSGTGKQKSSSASVPLVTAPGHTHRDPIDRSTVAWTWVGAATVGTAAVLASFAGPEMALAAGLLITFAAIAALRLTAQTIANVGVLAWLLGPCGAVLAAVAAHLSNAAQYWRGFELLGAVLAATAMLARGLLDAQAQRPVEHMLRGLLRSLPAHVHIPGRAIGEAVEPPWERVETARIRVGEEIVARRGELLGVDGTVLSGEAKLLPYPGAESSVTRGPGDAVLAGARITDGSLRVLATRVGDDRALARLARCGSISRRDVSPFLRRVHALTRWAAWLIVALCAGLLLFGKAAGLASPLSAVSAILLAAPLLAVRRAAERPLVSAAATASARGILFQSGNAFDLAGRVSIVAMAPHRTLTEGKPEVIDWLLLGDDADPSEVLGAVAGAELLAGDHPIGRALIAYAEKRNATPREVRRATPVEGRGLTAIGPNGEELVVGSRRLLLDQGVSVAAADAYAARAEATGRTVVFVALGGRVRAVFALHDPLRAGARAAVQRLFDLGLEVVLLTGDQRGPVEQLAAGFDIAHIKCELLPAERGEEVLNLRDAGTGVAVVGFPGADSAALAAADVAIALGAAGGATGENSIALVSEDLRDAAAAIWIARAARTRAVGSIRLALLTFSGAVGLAVSGLLSPALAALVALVIDAHGIYSGSRLRRRIALRLPASS